MATNNYTLAPQPPTIFTYLGQSAAGASVIGGVLVGDYVNNSTTTPPGSNYNVPSVTSVAGVPVSAILELQSTTGAFLVPRMTTTQRNALVTVANGMCIYNTTTAVFNFYQNGGWVALSAGAGGVVGPGGGSTDNAIARWDGTGGATLQNSVVLVGDTGAVTGVLTVAADAGTVGAPSYTFTSHLTTGMYYSNTNTVGFAANGLLSFQVASTASTVNSVIASGGATNAGDAALQPGFTAFGSDTNVDIAVTGKGTGGFAILPSTTGVAGSVKVWNAAGTFYTKLAAGVNLANLSLTLPIVDATTAKAPLVSNASGVLTFANNASLTSGTTAAYAGGGTSNAFTATGLTTSSIVTAVILTSTNSVSITKAVPTANTLTVTFSADPGADTTVSWIATAGAA